MSEKKWVVDLSEEERSELLELIRKGKAAARRLTRAHILLLADERRTDDEIAARAAYQSLDGGTGPPSLRRGGHRRRHSPSGLDLALSPCWMPMVRPCC